MLGLKSNNRLPAFTLIELVLVIAILGILAVAALPNLFNISLTNARSSAMKATVGAVQTGLSIYAASQISQGNAESYPATLDSAAVGAAASGTTPLFTNILKNGVNAQWFKVSETCFVYDSNGNGAVNTTAAGDIAFTYAPAAGTFIQSSCN